MKKIMSTVLMLLLFVSSHLGAVIVETSKLKSLYEYVDNDTVVVFDLDHTIIENEIDLDSWIPENITKLQEEGLSQNDAVQYTLSMYYTLQHFVTLHPIGGSKEIIENLQNHNIKVLALTNRSIPVLQTTIKQLKNKGIDFSRTSVSKKDLKLSVTHAGKFSQGIISAGANDKGAMLFAYFNAIGYKPKKIVFVDDKIKYVESVEKTAKNNNVDYVGIRLSLQDHKKKNINFDQLKKQLYLVKTQIGLESLSKNL
ncbi:MAG: DUF2608 domain-containing protein [bacterium]